MKNTIDSYKSKPKKVRTKPHIEYNPSNIFFNQSVKCNKKIK